MKIKRCWLLVTVGLTCVMLGGNALAKPGICLWEAEAPTKATGLTELTKENIPIEPGKKLEITFSARSSGKFTVEENARIGILNANNVASALKLQFFDAQDQRIEEITLPVLTASSHQYGRVVYPPPLAKSLNIFLLPTASGELTVENIRVTQELEGVEAECVNPHPTFLYGDLNSYGFGGELFERPDGKTVWNTGFTGQSSSFPVQGGGSYELLGRGVGYSGKRSKIFLQLFKEGDKRPFHTIPVRFSAQGESAQIVLPEGAVSANLLGYYAIVEELKIMKSPK